jgi:hypothetical protein
MSNEKVFPKGFMFKAPVNAPATKKEDAKNAAEILHGGKLPDYNVFGEEPTNSDDDLPF